MLVFGALLRNGPRLCRSYKASPAPAADAAPWLMPCSAVPRVVFRLAVPPCPLPASTGRSPWPFSTVSAPPCTPPHCIACLFAFVLITPHCTSATGPCPIINVPSLTDQVRPSLTRCQEGSCAPLRRIHQQANQSTRAVHSTSTSVVGAILIC